MLYSSLFQSLSASMVVTFLCGATFFTIGLLMTFCQKLIMEDFLDPVVKKANLTQLLINSYESIVPTKDDLPTSVYLGSWTTTLPYGVLIVGVAMLAFSVFGSFAARFMSSLPLTILIAMLVMTINGQYWLTINIMYVTSTLHASTKHDLMKTLHEDYEVGAKTKNSFSFFMNSIMLMGECCGVEGLSDFAKMNLTFVYTEEKTTKSVPLAFPPACCKATFINQGFRETLSCAASKDIENANTEGCYNVLFDKTIGSRRILIIIFVFVIIGMEIIQALLAILLLIRPKPEEIEARKQAMMARNYKRKYDSRGIRYI
ncbi:uncharacterized protein LOC106055216 isoform X2 [Biomphalaria glabrata]|uniref:Uncharacterized protein LOC106055216 isoform X2 n=2 Tax=Biomphalaria glabrata TaxID=6526 RepID=A0A9W2YU91_BIOGL|nr:uncharacterized protein LOC106055216 isoform X2 [Biomphalaria glabrata]